MIAVQHFFFINILCADTESYQCCQIFLLTMDVSQKFVEIAMMLWSNQSGKEMTQAFVLKEWDPTILGAIVKNKNETDTTVQRKENQGGSSSGALQSKIWSLPLVEVVPWLKQALDIWRNMLPPCCLATNPFISVRKPWALVLSSLEMASS